MTFQSISGIAGRNQGGVWKEATVDIHTNARNLSNSNLGPDQQGWSA